MRQKKHKKVTRTLNFLKITHRFHEPFKVVLDGNFINALLQSKTNAAEAIGKLLSAPVKLYTSRCVLRELHLLGPDFKEAVGASRDFMVLHCGHEDKAQSAAECLTSVLGDNNPQHMFIATQDRTLRATLARIPGAALIFASVNGLHLEAPSAQQVSDAKAGVAAQLGVQASERKSKALAVPLVSAARNEHSTFKRQKAKGPNPLSVKKSAKKDGQMLGDPNNTSSSGGVKKRARRKKPQTAVHSHKELDN